MTRATCWPLLFAALLAVVPAWAQNSAGRFQFVAGDVKVLGRDGVQRLPAKGAPLHEGDTIVSGGNGIAQIMMNDGGLIAVRADTHMRVDEFVYRGKEDGSERSLITLLQGGFRAITGAVGRRNKHNYRVKTATATIGIRGTDHEPFVVLAGVTRLPDPPGTYLKVNQGAAVLQTPKGLVQVNPNQAAFVAAANIAPRLLPRVPEFYKPIPIGAPRDAARQPVPGQDSTAGEAPSTVPLTRPGTLTQPATTLTRQGELKTAPEATLKPLDSVSPTTEPVKPLTDTTRGVLSAPVESVDKSLAPASTSIAPTLTSPTSPAITPVAPAAQPAPTTQIAPVLQTAPQSLTKPATGSLQQVPVTTKPATPVQSAPAQIRNTSPALDSPALTAPKTKP